MVEASHVSTLHRGGTAGPGTQQPGGEEEDDVMYEAKSFDYGKYILVRRGGWRSCVGWCIDSWL